MFVTVFVTELAAAVTDCCTSLVHMSSMFCVLQIETQKLNFKEKAQSKVGSKDNIQHKPTGGDKKVGGGGGEGGYQRSRDF